MGAEVWGDVADAEAAVGSCIGRLRDQRGEIRVAFGPGAVLGQELGLCAARVEIEGVEKIAVERGIFRT